MILGAWNIALENKEREISNFSMTVMKVNVGSGDILSDTWGGIVTGYSIRRINRVHWVWTYVVQVCGIYF